jgi:hypothetical protein
MTKLVTKKIYLIIVLIILLFFSWFSWMSFITSNTNKMEDRVKGLLITGLQIAEIDTPRVKVDNYGGFYGPDLNNPNAFAKEVYPKVYSAILQGLQDERFPFCKVENIRMDTDYISELRAYATVKFEEFPGITKTISVSESIKAPKYKEMTGLDEISDK